MQDLEGMQINDRKVLGLDAFRRHRTTYWIVQCKCGRIDSIEQKYLISNPAKSCQVCLGRKYEFNDHWLDYIGTNQAYFLGFMYGDGWVVETRKNQSISYRCSLEINMVDEEILHVFNNWLNANNPISFRRKAMAQVNWCSEYFNKSLGKYGIVPNKTYQNTDFNFLNEFNDNLFNAWLHGFWDADGFISKNGTIGICTHKSSLDLFDILMQRLGIFGKIRLEENTVKLRFTKKEALQLLPRLYQTGFRGLARKFNHAQFICESGYLGKNKFSLT